MLLFQEWSDGGGRGECIKIYEVNVMVQDYRYDEQEFYYFYCYFMTRKDLQILVHMSGVV